MLAAITRSVRVGDGLRRRRRAAVDSSQARRAVNTQNGQDLAAEADLAVGAPHPALVEEEHRDGA